MPTADNVFLVPTDFTSVADCALDHALSVAKKVGGEIVLLHVIAKDKEKDAAQSKLDRISKDAAAASGVPVRGITKTGNIFDDIGGVAETLNAKLIFMGTHGVKGIQHVVGSYAVKVVTNSNVPFIVVQERKMRNGYNRIVLPMDLTKESKHNIELVSLMAKYFGSEVYIFSQFETDEFNRKAIERNTAFAHNELNKKGVKHEVHQAKEKGSFLKQVIDFSSSVDADLIAVVNTQERGVPELFSGTAEREAITNQSGIPIMIVNPLAITSSKISYFILGQ